MDLNGEPHHRKVLITGTGRSGTSFTMQVLTSLGLPTGFQTPASGFFPTRMCGQEVEIDPATPANDMALYPRIVKDPRFLHTLGRFLDAGTLDPIHVYVLIRDVRDAARSRVDRSMIWDPVENTETPGFATADPSERVQEQARSLYAGLGMLLESLALYEVPYTTVLFPRLALDADYFAGSFKEILAGIGLDRVRSAHATLSDPNAIHYQP